MDTRFRELLLVLMSAAAAGACHDDGKSVHGCPTSYSSDWAGHALNLEHVLPDECPVFLTTPGVFKETGATVVDGGIPEFMEAFLNVSDFSGDAVGNTFVIFDRDVDGRWASPIYVSYFAGQDDLAPDKAFFRLTYLPGGVPGPEATMHISYTNAVIANISGPGLLSVGSSATYTASLSAGQAPFTYAWYRDWELVSTSNSYTGDFDVEGEVYLRLDVTDARGEVDSSSKTVRVNPCTDGAKVC